MSTHTKPFVLYTAVTPNGQQVSVFLEELKSAYPQANIDYEWASLIYLISLVDLNRRYASLEKINIMQDTQKAWLP